MEPDSVTRDNVPTSFDRIMNRYQFYQRKMKESK